MHFDVSDSLVISVLLDITPLMKSLLIPAASQKVLAFIPGSLSLWLHQLKTHKQFAEVWLIFWQPVYLRASDC